MLFLTTLIHKPSFFYILKRTTGVSLFLIPLFLLMPFSGFSQTIVEKNGALKVSGNKILNQNDVPVSFAGNSLFWSNAGWGGEKYYNAEVVDFLQREWNTTIIRAAMGVEDNGGYLQNKEREKNKVITVVDAAIEAGIYVIIDWHSHHAEDYLQESIDFFTEMAELYGDKPHVIFEIYNEPLQISWENTLKPYSETVIAAIRATGTNNLIIVGTPNWSQWVDQAAEDPITGYDNVAYTLHFYASTHKQSLRDLAQIALDKGLALMVTEWGAVEASGNGPVNDASVNEWMEFLKINEISHLNWALNDKNETASALKPGASATGGWTENEYTESGMLVKNIIQNWNSLEEEGEEEVITALTHNGKGSDVNVFPVPFTSEVNIKFSGIKKIQAIELYNVGGRLLQSIPLSQVQNGTLKVFIDNPGKVFVLRITGKDKVYSRSILRY